MEHVEQPEVFGKYLLIDRVSVGGMAEVFKAITVGVSGFQKILAIKRVLPNVAEDDEFIKMFVDEANIAGQLHHANIAQIYDLGVVNDAYFIALEYVEGKDLRAIFDRQKKTRKRLPVEMALFIAAEILGGLDYAHRKTDATQQPLNIVHRDVSPPNILLSHEGEVKLIDFGIAKAARKISKTQAGILKGKFGYMSPEQVRGLPIDGRSDVFSVGIVLYEMLAARRLFVGDTDFATLEKVRGMEITPPSHYNDQIPPEVDAMVMRALERDMNKRYASALDMQHDLQRYLYKQETIFTQHALSAWMKENFKQDLDRATQLVEKVEKLDFNHLGIDLAALEQASVRSLRTESVAPREKSEIEEPVEIASDVVPAKKPGKEKERKAEEKKPVEESPKSQKTGSKPITQPRKKPTRLARTKEKSSPLPVFSEENEDKPLINDEQEIGPFISPTLLGGILTVLLAMLILVGWFLVENVEEKIITLGTPGESGTVIFNANRVDTVVRVDGQEICITPCKIVDYPVGEHEAVFEKSGFLADRVPFRIKNDRQEKVFGGLYEAGMAPAVLLVQSEPSGAEVWLNNKPAPGPTPTVIKDVKAGVPHTLKVTATGYKDEILSVVLEKEAFHTTSLVLSPLSPSARVISEPPGAQVWIDGKKTAYLTPARISDLESGKHYQIKLVKAGYQASNLKIQAFAGDEKRVEVELLPEGQSRIESPSRKETKLNYGWLTVFTDPQAKIYINGRFTGRYSPAMNIKLPVGQHELKLINPDFNIHDVRKINIRGGQTSRINNRYNRE